MGLFDETQDVASIIPRFFLLSSRLSLERLSRDFDLIMLMILSFEFFFFLLLEVMLFIKTLVLKDLNRTLWWREDINTFSM